MVEQSAFEEADKAPWQCPDDSSINADVEVHFITLVADSMRIVRCLEVTVVGVQHVLTRDVICAHAQCVDVVTVTNIAFADYNRLDTDVCCGRNWSSWNTSRTLGLDSHNCRALSHEFLHACRSTAAIMTCSESGGGHAVA
jgi:hypothetical protein